jgi:GT2 family glycosyltransferase
MDLSIVIPNYNGKELLKKNIPRVLAAAPGSEIIIVDDYSEDDSVAFIEKEFPKIQLIKKQKNEGFSTTVNIGVAAARHELVMLLNSDAYPEEGFFDYIESHFANSDVFAVGLLQKSVEEDGVVLRGRGIGSFRRGFLMHERGEVDKTTTLWVSGGAGVFRKSIWDKLGGMCELYNPFYWEDIDLSYRAAKAGYILIFEPKSIVGHEQSRGSIRTKYSSLYIKGIAYRNQIYFVWLNISDKVYLAQHIIFFPYHLIKTLLRGEGSFFYAWTMSILQIRSILKQRSKNKNFWKYSDKKTFDMLQYHT